MICWVFATNCSSLELDILIFGTFYLPSTLIITYVPTF
jgi:hypothetical protein